MAYFTSLKFIRTAILGLCGVISQKLLIKSRDQNIFQKFELNRNLQRIPFKMMYNVSMLRHRINGGDGGERGGERGWARTP